MNIKHKWAVTKMDILTDTKYVKNVQCSITTTADEKPLNSMTQNLSVDIPYNPNDEIIPYENLTEEIVIEWVKKELKIYELNDDGLFVLDSTGNRIEIGDQVPDILKSGEMQLYELINPKVITLPLPWQTV